MPLTTPSEREFLVICRLIYYEQESIEISQKDAYALSNITVNTMTLNDPQWLIFVKSSKICKSIYKVKKAGKSRRILLSTLARMVIVRGDALEIRYNYANEYPALQNPVKAECSYNHRLVEMRGVEPLSKKPVP